MPLIKPPQLPKPLPLQTLTALENGAEYTAGAFSNVDLSNQTAADLIFDQVSLQRLIFQCTRLTRPRFYDVRASGCDFSGADWEKARFRRAEFNGCRLMGVQLLEAQFEHVSFKECNLEGALFVSSAFKTARFENCNLRGSSFEQADLSGVIFRRCDLAQTNLAAAKLPGADFRGSLLSGVIMRSEDIRGVLIESSQAIQVVGLLGVIINDDLIS
jgi:uncharacterized protein YjbI with pentapeptide repeats